MPAFTSHTSQTKNMFIKNDPRMLKNIYGTTDITPYWVADMDFKVAQPISNALHDLVNRGVYAYEFNLKGVQSALVAWYEKRHQLSLNSDRFIQVPGVLSGLALLIREFSSDNDAILLHSPAYHQFESLITRANRKVVKSELVIKDGHYQLDLEAMEQQIQTQNVKIILMCNPHNPTGRVWNEDELTAVVKLAQRHDIMIISDEIHSDILLSQSRFTSLASFDYENIIALLGSPAKTFGMHSISNGYLYTNNKDYVEQTKALVSALYLDHGNALSTFATIAAYKEGHEWLDEMLVYLNESVEWVDAYLQHELPEVKMFKPQGTYQIWFDFSALNLNNNELQSLLFHKAKMGLTPSSWFGSNDASLYRMNIATSLENIQYSFRQLKDAVEELKSNPDSLPSSCKDKPKSSTGCC
ncbi:aminotransferase class I/II-fold pyridoxal phosphate-dependent enzyme [uncultured Vibrio sp.]|uniref:MalY/PatB family protein n=1 Tax=uncultured Vibrio sp. TaxID=114054 RepID=UPI0025DB5E41|nr:aminotransferase class I/II-fold pyridoxal phosphate-dependent enzyme [uncultured Vibrio sp.]